jgi:hypothetical protein
LLHVGRVPCAWLGVVAPVGLRAGVDGAWEAEAGAAGVELEGWEGGG